MTIAPACGRRRTETGHAELPRRDLLALGAGLGAFPALARAQPEGPAVQAPSLATDTWTRFFAAQRVWAYADRLSLQPGERFNVMASTGPGQAARRVRLEVFRMGAADQAPRMDQ